MSILIKGLPLAGYEISIMKDGERYRARVDGIWCDVEEIPTTEADSDTISRAKAIDGKICIRRSNGVEIYDDYVVPVEYLEQLPPAQPERIKGHWIDKPSGRYGQWQSWCSACGKRSGIGGAESNRHKPFCPNCGADMREVTT